MRPFERISLVLKPEADKITSRISSQIFKYGKRNNIPTSYFVPMDETQKVLFVSIGGDGTMLGAMRKSLDYPNSMVLGLNTGSLGFLSDEIPADLDGYMDKIYSGNGVEIDTRLVTECEIFINNISTGNKFRSINEVVLTGKSLSDPLVTKVYINDHFVSEQLGNGVLVSTSTGSTAMSLSAGGSIVSPATNILQIVPLIAHTLTARPIISTGRDSIIIKVELTNRISGIEVLSDGRPMISSDFDRTNPIIELKIKKYVNDIGIWRPQNWNFFDVLAHKMKW